MTKKDLINEVVGYLRVAAKKYYHGSSLYKHETDILNRLSPSARKKELEKFTKQWRSEKDACAHRRKLRCKWRSSRAYLFTHAFPRIKSHLADARL